MQTLWPWVKIRTESFLLPQAMNPTLPKWQRVALLAYSRLNPTGHVEFAPGELAEFLSVNRRTGEVAASEAANVARHIGRAAEEGWVHASSNSRCIVVPEWLLASGRGPRAVVCVHGTIRATVAEDWS